MAKKDNRGKKGKRVRDMKSLIIFLDMTGIDWERKNSGHMVIYTPDGPYFTGWTPSDPRAILNVRSTLRRKGVPVP